MTLSADTPDHPSRMSVGERQWGSKGREQRVGGYYGNPGKSDGLWPGSSQGDVKRLASGGILT